MFVVVVEFTLAPEAFDSFLRRVKQQAEDSLNQESHCHQFDVCTSDECENFVLLYEVYTDAAAFQFHLDSEHFRAFDQDVANWITDKKVQTCHRQ